MKIEIKKLTPADAEEYIRFFDRTPHDDHNPENTCYCVSWCSDDHRTMAVYPSREERRAMAAEYVKSGKIQGYLAYEDGEIVGWCNANTRSECMNCGGWLFTMPQVRETQLDKNEKVKSIYCFLIAPDRKRKGIAKQLLQYVCQDAENDGFDYIEAYPQKDTTDERMFFMGFTDMYKDLGFHIYAETGDKYIMRKQLSRKKKIHIIGAAILDVLVSPAESEVFSTGSYPAEEIGMSFGGDALNEATVLASLGKKVHLQTVIGRDTAGEMIRHHCDRLGIELEQGCVRENLMTGINVVLVQKSGERNFLTNRNGSLRKLTLQDVRRPFPGEVGILCFASIFVFPEIGGDEMADIFRSAKEQGLTVCADMTKCKNGETTEDIAEALSYVDYLIPNEEEAFLITGERSIEGAAEKLRSCGVKNVIIKCGKRGCYLRGRDIAKYVPAVENVNCVDTTGAGDSFTAGFLYGLSEGWQIEKCAQFANECGAKAVEKLGATTWCICG